MNVIYLNNFRGFKNEFLHVEKINFFIGENSTGKTSVLKIFKALADSNFWLRKSLTLDSADLGFFHEIAGTSSMETSSFFEIGCLDYSGKLAIKLRYVEDKGLPLLKEVFILNNGLNFQFQIEGDKKILYRFGNSDDISTNEKFLTYFQKWVKGIELSQTQFQEKKLNSFEMPIYFVLMNIMRDNSTDNKSSGFNIPVMARNIYWLAPIRSQARRVYDSPGTEYNPDGSHAPYLLRDLLQFSTNKIDTDKKQKIEYILNKFGADSGLFEQINIRLYENLYTSPFQIQIKIGGRNMNFTNVGYGVSQILPVLVDIIVRDENTLFAIQQPEVHLHPKGQAAFGDFIYKAFLEENKMFIIETHSDYLIDRFRIRLSRHATEGKEEVIPSQIVYFSRTNEGNKMTTIKLGRDGKLPDNLPEGYRDFFIREQFNLLDI